MVIFYSTPKVRKLVNTTKLCLPVHILNVSLVRLVCFLNFYQYQKGCWIQACTKMIIRVISLTGKFDFFDKLQPKTCKKKHHKLAENICSRCCFHSTYSSKQSCLQNSHAHKQPMTLFIPHLQWSSLLFFFTVMLGIKKEEEQFKTSYRHCCTGA